MRACGYASIHFCMMVRHNRLEVPRDDVAAWESVLDLMLQEQSEALRHPGLVEVFKAAGLGLRRMECTGWRSART